LPKLKDKEMKKDQVRMCKVNSVLTVGESARGEEGLARLTLAQVASWKEQVGGVRNIAAVDLAKALWPVILAL
jgi:hypothetical protein